MSAHPGAGAVWQPHRDGAVRKDSAERVFSEIGISMTEAIRLFLKQVELYRGLPFPVSIPNAATAAAMRQANNPARLNRYGSFSELRKKV